MLLYASNNVAPWVKMFLLSSCNDSNKCNESSFQVSMKTNSLEPGNSTSLCLLFFRSKVVACMLYSLHSNKYKYVVQYACWAINQIVICVILTIININTTGNYDRVTHFKSFLRMKGSFSKKTCKIAVLYLLFFFLKFAFRLPEVLFRHVPRFRNSSSAYRHDNHKTSLQTPE